MMSTDAAVTSVAQVEDATYTNDRPRGTTSELDITPPRSWGREPVTEKIFLVVVIFGIIANVAMLISLLVYKRASRKTISFFICNQTILDVVAMFVSAFKVALFMSGYLQTKTGVLRIC